VRIGITVALCALALPAVAMAKGPTQATIAGPGLAEPLKLGGPNGWRAGSPMEVLTTGGGFFQVAWGGSPGLTLAKSPTARLGPKYRVVYVVPGPSGKDDRIRQDLYPFARGGPLTYTPPGQPFFDTRRTHGGWFRGAPDLKRVVVAARPPSPGHLPASADEDSGLPRARWVLVPILAVAAVALVGTRRRVRAAFRLTRYSLLY
jgi:hypothetical protein